MSGVDSEDGSLDSKDRLYQLSRYRVEPKEKKKDAGSDLVRVV